MQSPDWKEGEDGMDGIWKLRNKGKKIRIKIGKGKK